MAILESGLIVNGNPIIYSEYYESDIQVNLNIKSSLVTALKSFATTVFEDEVEEMRLKRYKLLIKDLDPESNQQFFLYAIIEKGTESTEVKKRLKILAKKIPLDRELLVSPVKTKEIEEIKEMIDEELKDLCLKPGDRAKNLWG